MFSGTAPNGQFTFLIRADGRGASCFRNTYSGKVMAGDLRYQGNLMYTEDGALTIDSVTQDEIKTHVERTALTFRRITEVPVVCREFFSTR